MRELPWPAKVYLVAVIGAASALIGRSLIGRRPVARARCHLLVLALLFLVCESMPTLLNVEQVAVSVSFSAALAAVVLVGPEGAALVGMTAVLQRAARAAAHQTGVQRRAVRHLRLRGRRRLRLARWRGRRADVDGFDELIVPFAGAAAVFVPLNFILIALMLVAGRSGATRCRCAGWPSSWSPTWDTPRSGC